jgi:hypothetical protein
MTESRNRDLATSIGAAVASDNIATDGTLAISGVVTYTNLADLPSSGVSAGDLGFVTANNGLYIRGSSGWYVIALVNTSPSYTTSPASSYELATDGTTTTVITIVATDPEGFAITYSATADSGFNGLATVSQSSNVFTVTPKSEANATTESGTLTFRATDGVNNTDVVSTFTLTFINIVQNSAETVLLAKATGNTGTNNSFTDNSSSSHTITTNGNANASTFSPYRSGGYSAYFDGTGDYLSIPTDTSLELGSSNYTIECWFYLTTSIATNDGLISMGQSGSTSTFASLQFDSSRRINWFISQYSTSSGVLQSPVIQMNTWYHVAVTRNGNDHVMYLNGNSVATQTTSYTNTIGNVFYIGCGWYATDRTFYGYITDVRVVKGTAVYTSEFSPLSERLTAITNTSLLACHLPYFADGSTNSHTITVNGSTKPEPFAPYDYNPYSASNHGGSALFDGTGDNLVLADDDTLEFGSGDFTIEAWVYPTAIDSSYSVIVNRWDSGSTKSYIFALTSSAVWFYYSTTGSDQTLRQWSETVILNTWTHLAIVRNGNDLNLFVNGSEHATTNSLSGVTLYGGTSTTKIGSLGDPNNTTDFIGYISDVRLVKGTAVYTAAFTPPTALLSAISGTSFLALQGDASIFDAAQFKDITLNGDAASSTGQTKNAGSSMYFDGSGDSVEIDTGEKLGTGDFTIEWWAYQTASPSYAMVFAQGYSSTGIGSHMRSNGDITVTRPGQAVDHTFASGINTINTWYHVALTRSSGTIRCYVDGAETGSAANTIDYQAGTLYLGVDGNGSSSPYTGYIEDFRITKGLSRYPFVPPEETLTAITNTSLLTAHADTIIDGSTNAHTVTNNGNAPVSSFAPFTGGYSVYFDGSGDYLSMASDNSFALGTGDFTVEGWFYQNSDNTYPTAFEIGDHLNSTGILFIVKHSGQAKIYSGGFYGGATTSLNQWNHIAWVRSSGSLKIFVNGVLGSTTAFTNNLTDTAIMKIAYTRGTAYIYTGYISNLRLVKGTAVYTNSFTPPTAELKG